MKTYACLSLILAAGAVAGCAQEDPSKRPAVAPKAEVVGAAESCVQLSQVRETRIRDDWTIDFVGNGDRVWRNTLTSRCPGLKSENAFTYETSLSQLCNVDIVYVLQNLGGRLQRGPGCGLGQFVPVKLEKK